jgi:hypothetical protein
MRLRSNERHGIRMLLAIRGWQLSVFADLHR